MVPSAKDASMPFLDLPPQLEERVVCSITAAIKYEVPVNIVLAVAEKEAGKPGQWVRNANGTHDIGAMQFNTKYLQDLARYGIQAQDVAAAGDLAAWRLRGHLKHDHGDLWTRAANYHSRTPKYNAVYRADLIAKAVKWADWLDALFVTMDVTQAGATLPMPAAGRPVQAVKPVAAVPPAASVAWQTDGYIPRKVMLNGQP